MRPNSPIIVFALFTIIALLFADNFVLRKKIEAIQLLTERKFDELDLPLLKQDLEDVKADLAANSQEDALFRENQTKFDGNVIRVLKECKLIQ